MSAKRISGHLLNLASNYIYVSWFVCDTLKKDLSETLNEPSMASQRNQKNRPKETLKETLNDILKKPKRHPKETLNETLKKP